jgi:hypothetical protein
MQRPLLLGLCVLCTPLQGKWGVLGGTLSSRQGPRPCTSAWVERREFGDTLHTLVDWAFVPCIGYLRAGTLWRGLSSRASAAGRVGK